MLRTHRILLIPLLAAVLVLAAGCSSSEDDVDDTPAPASGGSPPTERTGITARGTGEVTGAPDILLMNMGVETGAGTASDALDDNNNRTRSLIDTLKSAGVADEDLQTSELSVSPTFDDDRRITGYRVSNGLSVVLRDVDRAGEVIDAATAAAGDAVRLQGLRFDIDDTSDLYAEARADAVTRARAQAEQLAGAAEVELGDVRSITEDPAGGPMPTAVADQAAADTAVPIEAGSQELRLQVTVVYDIA